MQIVLALLVMLSAHCEVMVDLSDAEPRCWDSARHYNRCCILGDQMCFVKDGVISTHHYESCCGGAQDRLRAFRAYGHHAISYREGYIAHPPAFGASSDWQPFIDFVGRWLHNNRVVTLVDASCGLWPSHWQSEVDWPSLEYLGLDIQPDIIVNNQDFIKNHTSHGYDLFGLRSIDFDVYDMSHDSLPTADVLVTKDTLIHFPNGQIQNFLNLSVLACPPRFRYVLFVHDQANPDTSQDVNNADVGPFFHVNLYHGLDLAAEPFNLPVENIFAWEEGGKRKAVQLWSYLNSTCTAPRAETGAEMLARKYATWPSPLPRELWT